MDWKNWKTWSLLSGVALALAAIYAFAYPAGLLREPDVIPAIDGPLPTGETQSPRVRGESLVRVDMLTPQTASYEIDRNLFGFVEPPPPAPEPPPKPAAPPPPPPDTDGDGVPDARDNCPEVANPDQRDIDRDGIGTACETEKEIPPPPPKRRPPAFDWKLLGTFGPKNAQIASFSKGDEIINVRVGNTIDERFILKQIGLESVEIGYVGFPPDETTRVPIGQ